MKIYTVRMKSMNGNYFRSYTDYEEALAKYENCRIRHEQLKINGEDSMIGLYEYERGYFSVEIPIFQIW